MKTAFTAEQKVLQMAQDELRLGIEAIPLHVGMGSEIPLIVAYC